MHHHVNYRLAIGEGCIFYTLGRVGALITPAIFPDWLYVALPLLFLILQYLLPPVWATRRIQSSKQERLSRRFLLLGPQLAILCLGIDIFITVTLGLPVSSIGGVQQGSAIWRLLTNSPHHLSFSELGLYEIRTAALLLALFTIAVVCTRLAQGGFLRFTMPTGKNRVTL